MKDAEVKLTSAKSQTAVELSRTGVTEVRVAPPAEYADPDVFPSHDPMHQVVTLLK